MLPKRIARAVVVVAATLTLAGCASFGEGFGRAVLSQLQVEPDVDRRACEIHGAPFDGILAALQQQDGQGPVAFTSSSQRTLVKLFFVHGIGLHQPGYSGRTLANLTQALELDVVAPQTKSIELIDADFPGQSLGTLSVQRFTDKDGERELIAYELTWSGVSSNARAELKFDSSEVHSRHRAPLNRLGKNFVNNALVDPLVYVGAGRNKILGAVRQGMCWANSTDWDGFPEASSECRRDVPEYGSRLPLDRFFFVTHSLGSRIVLDALETSAEGISLRRDLDENSLPFLANLQNHTVTLFMMANQLPLLQAGFPPVPITGQIPAYCTPDGPLYDRRIVGRTLVIAFSDPNDLLSYPVPDDFVQYGIDSRLCPKVINMSLNVAHVMRVGRRDVFADPMSAHSRYNDDERVIGLMAGGLGRPETPPAVTERCNWVRVEESMR